MNQFTFNFDGYAVPNDSGVYVDAERITLEHKKVRAEIRIANAPFGFCWGMSVMFSAAGFCGMPNECDQKRGSFATTRDAAVKRACAELIARLTKGTSANPTELNIVRSWAEKVAA